jgi:hypothetical protein
MNRREEFLRFKRDISLVRFAMSCGYVLLKRESSRNSIALKSDSRNDKVIVAKSEDQTSLYFSVNDPQDHGTIIDFVQNRFKLGLGEVRRKLRPWLGALSLSSASAVPEPKPTDRDRQQVIRTASLFRPCTGDYLTSRGLHPDTDFAAWGLMEDADGNVCFLHRDEDGICGWEIRGEHNKAFSAGGSKGLAEANPNEGTSYISTAGSLSAEQARLIKARFTDQKLTRITIATDADAAGETLAAMLTSFVNPGVEVVRSRPSAGKDWNDELRQRRGQSARLVVP